MYRSTRIFPACLISISMIAILSACGGGGGGGGGGSSDDSNYKDPKEILDSNTLDTGFSVQAVADLNGDGFDDFIGARSTGLKSGVDAELLLLINDTKGSFKDETATFIDGPIPSFFLARDIHVADFNNDGKNDIFFSNHGKEGPDSDFLTWLCEQNVLLLSQPDGRLLNTTSTSLPNQPDFSHGSSVGDIDKDGDLDIWVNNLGCGATVSSYLLSNDGNGVFTKIASFDNPNGILPGNLPSFWSQFLDYNDDGFADLFLTDFADARLLLNDGMPNPTFSDINNSTIPDGVGQVTTQYSEALDINNDGLDDLLLFQNPDDFSPGHSLQILINNGVGFNDETAARLPAQNSTNSIGNPRFWTGDIDGDGHTDIMIGLFGPSFQPEDHVFDFYLNNGFGVFTEMDEDDLPTVEPDFTPIDVNNDGKLDFIFTSVTGENGDKPSLMLTIAD